MAWSGALSIANSVVLWALIARWRETEELGRFTIVMSIGSLFIILCSLGLGPYLTSEIARREESARAPFIASAAFYLLGWSVICVLVMTGTGFVVSASPEVHWANAILSLAMLPTGLISIAEPTFTAYGRARVIAMASTTENLARTIVPLVLLYHGYGLSAIFLMIVISRTMACVVYAVVLRHRLKALALAQWPLVREIAAKTPTFAGVTILAAVHWQVAAVFVGKLGGEAAAAEFGVASRILIPVSVLLSSFATVIQPTAARLAASSMDKLGEFISHNLKLVISLALPMAVGVTLLARDALVIIFSEKYAAAAVPLSLLAVSVIPFALVMITARGLVATGKQHIDLIANAAAVAANLALNLILIPRYGATGAAVAQLISMIVLAAVEVGYSALRLFRLSFGRAVTICALPLLLMALAVWQARQLGLWGAVVAGGVVYLGCLWFKRRELKFGV
jgi:O-antigen/teichoic acid export membrane protein